jgi:Zn/Cd-binding protein ZinT
MNYPGFISYVVPFVRPESIESGTKYPYVFSNHTEEETKQILFDKVQTLGDDYGMTPLNFEFGKRAKQYELKYHYITVKLFTSKSGYRGCLRLHFELKYDCLNGYGNTVDHLVFNQLYELYKELEIELLFH